MCGTRFSSSKRILSFFLALLLRKDCVLSFTEHSPSSWRFDFEAYSASLFKLISAAVFQDLNAQN